MSAGDGVTVDSALAPCVGCKVPTKIRVHGVPAHWIHAPATAPRTKVGEIRMSFLSDLHKDYAPLCKNNGKMSRPYFQPPMPAAIDLVVSIGWSWELPRVSSHGGQVVLDRTAAYLSAAASVEVAHSALVHRPGESSYRGLPGIYKVIHFPWEETSVPHPLGWAAKPGEEIWVTHPRAQLLQRLADQGRYPDGFITDAYTCAVDQTGKPQAVRLTKWTNHVQEVRRQVITEYGRYDPQSSDGQTEQYRKVKDRFSQARTMMVGSLGEHGRVYKESCLIHRPDWGMAIADQSSCTLWSWADDLAQIAAAHGGPDWGPIAMRNIDEIVIPLVALELLTTSRRDSNRGPIPIDPEGIKLGTFKVKKVAR